MYKSKHTIERVAAGVLQRPDGKILLLHRASDRKQEADLWCVVSGHIEPGETPKEAIVREISEELVGVRVGEPTMAGKAFILDSDHETAIIYPFLFTVSQHIRVEIEAEHQGYRWVHSTELLNYTIVPQLRQDLVHLGLLPRKLILGVVGRNAAGKDTLIQRLADQRGVKTLNISDQVREIARQRQLPLTRENLHAISAEYMAIDSEYFSKKTLESIEQNSDRVVAISGFRTAANVATFRRYFGDEFILIQVKMDSDKKRFAHMLRRHEQKDPTTWQQFLDQEQAEERIFGISNTMNLAEVIVANDGSLQHFFHLVDGLWMKLGSMWGILDKGHTEVFERTKVLKHKS